MEKLVSLKMKQQSLAISVNEEAKTFHLYNAYISYIIKVDENGKLLNLYYGKAIRNRDNFDHLLEFRAHPTSACSIAGNAIYSLEYLRQEFPEYGRGDFRTPAIQLKQPNGSTLTDYQYQGYQIIEGKPQLEGLPASYVESEDEAKTIQIKLWDEVTKTQVTLSYTIFRDFPVIARNAKIDNRADESYQLEKLASLSLDFPDANYEMLQLSGAWSRERHVYRRPLEPGIQSIGSTKGSSSHTHNPFLALLRKETTEAQGEAIGTTFVYSGNFLIQAEVDTFDVARLQVGIHPQGFSWKLNPGESFQSPEALLTYSNSGLNGMSQTFHEILRTHLCRGYWRDRERPILINNWEATYYDFDEDKLLKIAQQAKALGVELFVLDDGWFGQRDNDTMGLGDWIPRKDRLPHGVDGLASRMNELGLAFGLWIEPEMVNEKSDLYQAHPDWIIHTPDRKVSQGRNQYVLNFARPDVVDYIFDQIDQLLQSKRVSYIKWDMNRLITEAYDATLAPDQQGEVFHRYILGVYHLMDRLVNKYPTLLIESCASGGGRFDCGMLYYSPQIWTSDDSDAIERLKIQYGTSIVYPLSAMGAHVSAVPNHQVNRLTPLETRGNVAYFGTFGYELDLNALDEKELATIKKQIQFDKKYRALLHRGDFYRLVSPFDHNHASWMVVSKDKETAVIGDYKVLNEANAPYQRLQLQGLDPTYEYQVSGFEGTYYGDELMSVGLVTTDSASGENHPQAMLPKVGDFASNVWVVEAIKDDQNKEV